MPNNTVIHKESYYQSKIMKCLKETYPDAFIWKVAAGPYSQGGIPDICMILDGHAFFFEVKRPKVGRLTKLQEITIERINNSGGTAAIVTYPEEALQIVKRKMEEGCSFVNSPFDLLEEAFRKLYPGKKYQAVFSDVIKDGDGKAVFGETVFPDDGSIPIVSVSACLSIKDAVEIFAHELAHVAAGKECGHSEAWEVEFQKIFDEYNRIGSERFRGN